MWQIMCLIGSHMTLKFFSTLSRSQTWLIDRALATMPYIGVKKRKALIYVWLLNGTLEQISSKFCLGQYLRVITSCSPCLRTSSTAAISSSFRSWLSLAICSPFSRKFWVACSTDTASTWAFLERPFFLLDGPLLLVLTRVVTCGREE